MRMHRCSKNWQQLTSEPSSWSPIHLVFSVRTVEHGICQALFSTFQHVPPICKLTISLDVDGLDDSIVEHLYTKVFAQPTLQSLTLIDINHKRRSSENPPPPNWVTGLERNCQALKSLILPTYIARQSRLVHVSTLTSLDVTHAYVSTDQTAIDYTEMQLRNPHLQSLHLDLCDRFPLRVHLPALTTLSITTNYMNNEMKSFWASLLDPSNYLPALKHFKLDCWDRYGKAWSTRNLYLLHTHFVSLDICLSGDQKKPLIERLTDSIFFGTDPQRPRPSTLDADSKLRTIRVNIEYQHSNFSDIEQILRVLESCPTLQTFHLQIAHNNMTPDFLLAGLRGSNLPSADIWTISKSSPSTVSFQRGGG